MPSLDDFKILKEDGDCYHIGHPNGKKLVVSKAGLSEKAHAAIKKYAHGGTVEDGEGEYVDPAEDRAPASVDGGGAVAEAPKEEEAPSGLPNFMEPGLSNFGDSSVGQGSTGEIAMAQPQGVMAPQPGQASPEDQVKQAVSELDPMAQSKVGEESLLGNEEKNVRDYMRDEQAANNHKAQIYGDYVKQSEKMQTPQDIVASYKAKDDALLKAYTDQKLDPDRYLKNMSTGSKIAASIGLLFSGFGSGASGQSNFAMDHLTKAINDDIDAQKNEQGKNLNLYKMNQEALGNDLHAQAATQNQMWTGVQAKIAQATAQSQNPELRFKGQQMINEIEEKKIQNRMKLGLLSQGMGQGGLSNADPAQLVNELVPEHQRKDVLEEIGRAQNIAKNSSKILDAFDAAAGQFKGTPWDRSQVKAFHQMLLPNFKAIDGTVRQAAMDETFHNLTPQFGDSKETLAIKRQGVINWMHNESAAPTAKANGIDLSRFRSTVGDQFKERPKDEQYTAWAKANSSNPLAKKWLKQNGG